MTARAERIAALLLALAALVLAALGYPEISTALTGVAGWLGVSRPSDARALAEVSPEALGAELRRVVRRR